MARVEALEHAAKAPRFDEVTTRLDAVERQTVQRFLVVSDRVADHAKRIDALESDMEIVDMQLSKRAGDSLPSAGMARRRREGEEERYDV